MVKRLGGAGAFHTGGRARDSPSLSPRSKMSYLVVTLGILAILFVLRWALVSIRFRVPCWSEIDEACLKRGASKKKLEACSAEGIDVVIIGSGLGGLSTAAVLAKVGYKVCSAAPLPSKLNISHPPSQNAGPRPRAARCRGGRDTHFRRERFRVRRRRALRGAVPRIALVAAATRFQFPNRRRARMVHAR